MKKTILALLALGFIAFGSPALAADQPMNAPKPTLEKAQITSKHAITAQQQRMKNCAADYNAKKAAGKIQKSQYRPFMKVCLKNPAKAKALPPAAAPMAAPMPAPVTAAPVVEPYKAAPKQ
jgi:hypothetical protein